MKQVLLTDVCDIRYGYAFDSALFSDSEGVPLVRIRDVVRGSSETFTTEPFSEDYAVRDGDILIGMDGEFNIAKWRGGNAALNQRVCKMIPKRINEVYLLYFMRKTLKAIEDKTPFVTVKHLSAKELNKIIIPLPTDEEQKEIADTLWKVDELISLRKKQLQKLDDLVKSRFVEMFGEEIKCGLPLKECCIDVRGGGTPSMQHPEYYGGNVPFIKSGDVRGDAVFSGTLWLTDKAIEETTAKYVPQGSVLVVNRSAALLREFRAAIALRPVVINQDIKAFIPKDNYTSEYLLWAIKIQAQLLLTKVTTVLTSHIDLKDLLELRIADVSIKRQMEFSSFVAQVDKSKLAIQQGLNRLEQMKHALMQKYFG